MGLGGGAREAKTVGVSAKQRAVHFTAGDTDVNPDNVGTRLRAAMDAQALTLSKTAELSGVDVGNLCRILQNKLPLSAAYAWRLARVLGPEVLELVPEEKLRSHVDVTTGMRRRSLDRAGLAGYLLPGGAEVFWPTKLAGVR